jgi:thiol:disulfide interchange protein DsbC
MKKLPTLVFKSEKRINMKKIAFSVAALLSITNLLSANQTVTDFIQQQVPKDVKVELKSAEAIAGLKDYEANYLTLMKDGQIQNIIVFTKDNLMFNDIVDLNTGRSLKKQLMDKALAKTLAPAIETTPEDKTIFLKSKKSDAETIYILADPFCSHCRDAFKNIDTMIEKYNVKIIMVPILGEQSKRASILLYNEAKSIKNETDKLELLEKYFSIQTIPQSSVFSAEELDDVSKHIKKYTDAGLRGVPTIIHEKDMAK